jgi:hypothetical protein
MLETPEGPRKGLQVVVERGEGKKPLVASWGGMRVGSTIKGHPQ